VIVVNKVGFIARVKSKGRYYFYLRVSFREGKDYKPKNKNIYSFGNKEKAVNSLEEWINNHDLMPGELKGLGYDIEDVKGWITEIKNR
jgi:hypothetical protein